jgi:phenylalanyl-tRNA synthetase beta chain
MRVPLSWLRDFTPVQHEPAEVARSLSLLGLVVEGVEEVGMPLAGVTVARVLETRRHPAADRIQLVDVDAGDGEALQVCCGAFNMKAGDLVPLATVGTVMPSGVEIGRRKMRGEWSNGMLCSAAELGIGAEGPEPAIYVFAPGRAVPGQPAAEALGFEPDVVFDIEVSPNRSDCFSVAGVARDLAAGLGLPFRLPDVEHRVDGEVPRASVEVSPAAAQLCPRFTGTVVEGVLDAAVPPLVGRRLVLAGMRQVSPVVDASNYVMLELGQPNHPYDVALLGGHGLVVRRADEGEVVVTLDGVERQLVPDDLVIADANGHAVGIAGIMGGAGSGISASTTAVLLEVANFLPGAVAATGARLGLSSEARTRFERGVDIELAARAVDRFVELLGPGVRRGETTDLRQVPPGRRGARLRASRVNLVLGTALSAPQCVRFLEPLGFEAEPAGDGVYDVSVPTWRPDCTREVDLVEEVARIYGYDNVPRVMPPRPMAPSGLSRYQRGRRAAREALAGAGADEAWTSTFLSPGDMARAGLSAGPAVELENPLDQSQSLLRTSLLPGLLKAARFNVDRQAGALSLFEMGSVFRRPAPQGQPGLVDGVVEWEQLGLLALGGDVDAAYAVRCWEVLAAGLRLEGACLAPLDDEVAAAAPPGSLLSTAGALHPGRCGVVALAGAPAGLVGELAAEVAERNGLPGRVAVVLADLEVLLGGPGRAWSARPVSKYPATDLDMAFWVPEAVPAGTLAATVREGAGALAEDVVLFDVWRGEAPGAPGTPRRSLAFRARLRAPDRTLTEAEVDEVRRTVAALALDRHGAALRTG